MPQLLGPNQRRMEVRHSLVRIAQYNQAPGKMAQALYQAVLNSYQESSVTVLLRIVQGQCPLEVRPGRNQCATKEQSEPHIDVGHTVEKVIMLALRQPENLLGHLQRCPEFPLNGVKSKQPH
jgi:hypothetical protein